MEVQGGLMVSDKHHKRVVWKGGEEGGLMVYISLNLSSCM